VESSQNVYIPDFFLTLSEQLDVRLRNLCPKSSIISTSAFGFAKRCSRNSVWMCCHNGKRWGGHS